MTMAAMARKRTRRFKTWLSCAKMGKLSTCLAYGERQIYAHSAHLSLCTLHGEFFFYSNLSEIKKILERDGMESLQQFDSEGHTLVHWASLAGHLDMVTFLVDSGAPINEHSRNDYGPCPIHWGCVNGHIGIIGFFVDRGVPIDMTDMNGCTPLIIAAQYGQSLVISYLLQKGANRFHTDVNGDGALHWAAFKGV